MSFVTKDSGERKTFATGMVRDTTAGKLRPDLVYMPLFIRWAELMGRGAEKYGERNWEKASTDEELARFKESAFRHFMQWYLGLNPEEDHAAAVLFNIGGAEHVKAQTPPKPATMRPEAPPFPQVSVRDTGTFELCLDDDCEYEEDTLVYSTCPESDDEPISYYPTYPTYPQTRASMLTLEEDEDSVTSPSPGSPDSEDVWPCGAV